jgi:hypothetical protein
MSHPTAGKQFGVGPVDNRLGTPPNVISVQPPKQTDLQVRETVGGTKCSLLSHMSCRRIQRIWDGMGR